MNNDILWAGFGWLGSALVVFSLLQVNMIRLRIFNLAGCVLAVIYNFPLGIWPSVALNAAITIINAVQLVRLRKERALATSNAGERAPEGAPVVVRTGTDNVVVVSLLRSHRTEIEMHGEGSLEQILDRAADAILTFRDDRLVACSIINSVGDERIIYVASSLADIP